ncbi:hypothetical protein CLCR_07302 [Cladophialophora carrionii]|uniref:Zn(2)-C6 fungal-type domain-containing protein n=1 Tax=Cladophialophora carrionii TaxID=86049 RepID=A0A1C1CM60_9EURO|nr:hypothetical protein CLCR_07302 [Cladophialophora carrionii]
MPGPSESQPIINAETGGRIAKKRTQHSTGRRKRDPYTTHACNRCRAAKVRCDGRLPCTPCAARDPSTCHYSAQYLPTFLVEERQPEDTERPLPSLEATNRPARTGFRRDNEDSFHTSLLALLEQQGQRLDLLTGQMVMLTGAQKLSGRPSSREHGSERTRKRALPLLHSQTSSLFCINVIDSAAQQFDGSYKPPSQLGPMPPSAPSPFWIIQGEIIDGGWSDMTASDASDTPKSASHMNLPQILSPSSMIYPLEELDDNKIMQTIESYGILEGLMYPIVDTANVMRIAECLTAARARYSNQWPPEFQTFELCQSELTILKLVLATGLLTEGDMHNTMALRLFQSVHSEVESMLWSDAVDLKDLVAMTLTVMAPSTELQPLNKD